MPPMTTLVVTLGEVDPLGLTLPVVEAVELRDTLD